MDQDYNIEEIDPYDIEPGMWVRQPHWNIWQLVTRTSTAHIWITDPYDPNLNQQDYQYSKNTEIYLLRLDNKKTFKTGFAGFIKRIDATEDGKGATI